MCVYIYIYICPWLSCMCQIPPRKSADGTHAVDTRAANPVSATHTHTRTHNHIPTYPHTHTHTHAPTHPHTQTSHPIRQGG